MWNLYFTEHNLTPLQIVKKKKKKKEKKKNKIVSLIYLLNV